MGILIMLTGMIAMVPVVLFATLCMKNMSLKRRRQIPDRLMMAAVDL